MPSADAIKEALARVDWHKIQLEPRGAWCG